MESPSDIGPPAPEFMTMEHLGLARSRKANLKLEHYRPDPITGEDILLERREIHNIVTYAGYAAVAGLINGYGSLAAFTYIAIGLGASGPTTGDTALGSEISTLGGARAAGTASLITTSQTNDTAQLLHQFTFSGSFAVTETGMFNASSGPTLLARQVFSAINVISGDKLTITWDIQVT